MVFFPSSFWCCCSSDDVVVLVGIVRRDCCVASYFLSIQFHLFMEYRSFFRCTHAFIVCRFQCTDVHARMRFSVFYIQIISMIIVDPFNGERAFSIIFFQSLRIGRTHLASFASKHTPQMYWQTEQCNALLWKIAIDFRFNYVKWVEPIKIVAKCRKKRSQTHTHTLGWDGRRIK